MKVTDPIRASQLGCLSGPVPADDELQVGAAARAETRHQL